MCPSAEFRRSCSELLPEEPIEVGEIGKAGAFRHFHQFQFRFRKQTEHLFEPPFPQRLRDGQTGQSAVTAAQMSRGDLQCERDFPRLKPAGKLLFDLLIDDFGQPGMPVPAGELFLKPAELSQQNFQMG